MTASYSSKPLSKKDIGWILSICPQYATQQYLEDAMNCLNISFALMDGEVVKCIIVMMIGSGKHYVSLLWTDGSYGAIKWSMLFFRDLSKREELLFHSENSIIKRHRKEVLGCKSAKPYFRMVV